MTWQQRVEVIKSLREFQRCFWWWLQRCCFDDVYFLWSPASVLYITVFDCELSTFLWFFSPTFSSEQQMDINLSELLSLMTWSDVGQMAVDRRSNKNMFCCMVSIYDLHQRLHLQLPWRISDGLVFRGALCLLGDRGAKSTPHILNEYHGVCHPSPLRSLKVLTKTESQSGTSTLARNLHINPNRRADSERVIQKKHLLCSHPDIREKEEEDASVRTEMIGVKIMVFTMDPTPMVTF